MSGASRDDEIAAYYARGLERHRLADALEYMRTQLLLERHLPHPPAGRPIRLQALAEARRVCRTAGVVGVKRITT
jgi:hypothetical protein